MPDLIFDENGLLIEMAEVPNAGVIVKRKTGSEIGNKRHDAASGKFAPKGEKLKKESASPNADPIELKRMYDAARDMAREFDLPEEGDVREFLAGRAKNPAQVDIPSFINLVRENIKNDVLDMLDQKLRKEGALKRGRRTVRVQAPRGYLQRTMRGFSDDDIAELMHRLEARGHEREDIDKLFDRRVKEETASSAKEKREGIAASDDWVPPPYVYEHDAEDDGEAMEYAVEMAERIARSIQPPVVNVEPVIHVNVPEPKPMKRVITRDEKGLATVVEDVPDAS